MSNTELSLYIKNIDNLLQQKDLLPKQIEDRLKTVLLSRVKILDKLLKDLRNLCGNVHQYIAEDLTALDERRWWHFHKEKWQNKERVYIQNLSAETKQLVIAYNDWYKDNQSFFHKEKINLLSIQSYYSNNILKATSTQSRQRETKIIIENVQPILTNLILQIESLEKFHNNNLFTKAKEYVECVLILLSVHKASDKIQLELESLQRTMEEIYEETTRVFIIFNG